MRLLYGVLRPSYRGFVPTAAGFVRAKLQPVPAADECGVTAHRAEMWLPPTGDDRFGCPWTWAAAIDAERPANRPVLLTYATLTFPTERLHTMWETVRGFAQAVLVGEWGLGVLGVQHAPHKAGSDNPPHVHLLIGRKLTSLGLGGYAARLSGDGGRKLLVDRFADWCAEAGR